MGKQFQAQSIYRLVRPKKEEHLWPSKLCWAIMVFNVTLLFFKQVMNEVVYSWLTANKNLMGFPFTMPHTKILSILSEIFSQMKSSQFRLLSDIPTVMMKD